ncbi:hypothetical protein BsWGS_18701 [Bradybaena similaris]
MSTTGKEPDAGGEIRNASPALQEESPSNSVSARLQEEYSELLRYAVGVSGSDRKTFESSGQGFQPISKSGGSSARQTPVDQQHEWDAQMKTQGINGSGNINTNSLYMVQPPRYRTSIITSLADANVNNDIQYADNEKYEYTSRVNTAMSSACATIVEPPLACMSGKLDSWLGKLKQDILAEFKQLAVQVLESQKNAHQEEIKEINCERQMLEKEVNRLNEMVNACEQSMSRKDSVIDNLTQALGKQKDKVSMAQAFYLARVQHAEEKREKFTDCLATQHNTRRLTQKVMRAWYSLIQKNWKNRAQQICDKKAQDVCRQLSIDYEDKIKALNEEMENLNRKLKIMQNEKETYAMQVKKAFMRGVCALNMEAMSAFTPEDTQISPISDVGDNSNACNINNNLESNCPQKDDLQIKQVSADVAGSGTTDLHFGSGQFSSLAVVGTSHPQQSIFRPQKGKTRPSTAPSVSSSCQMKAWGTSQPLAPPMASVVVERHDPVTKQTVGKATASRYPKYSVCKGSGGQTKQKHVSRSLPVSQMFHTFQPLAGQTSSLTTPPGVKVVE